MLVCLFFFRVKDGGGGDYFESMVGRKRNVTATIIVKTVRRRQNNRLMEMTPIYVGYPLEPCLVITPDQAR
jgi:hypothetical protein